MNVETVASIGQQDHKKNHRNNANFITWRGRRDPGSVVVYKEEKRVYVAGSVFSQSTRQVLQITVEFWVLDHPTKIREI
jgi:hypothetical protein